MQWNGRYFGLTCSMALLLAACASHPPSRFNHAIPHYPETAINEEVKAIALSPEIHVIAETHAAHATYHAVLALTPQHVVMIDTLSNSKNAENLYEWINAKWPEAVVTAVNTSHLPSSVGGNDFLMHQARIDVYGAEQSAAHLPKQFKPNHVFDLTSGLTLQLADQELQLIFPGAAYSEDNLLVYAPGLHSLYAGPLLVNHQLFETHHRIDLDAWSSIVADLARFDAKWWIPGGPGDNTHPITFDQRQLNTTQSILSDQVVHPWTLDVNGIDV